jgi:K+-sensing histidine kinase KdpD
MRNEDKAEGRTREQLTEELATMRQQVAELEVSAAEHRQTEQELCQRNWELALLSRVGQEFTATLDLQQVTEQLLPAVTEIIGAEGASVWLWDEMAEGCLVCRTAYHRGQGCSPVDLRLRPGQGVAGWVAQKGESTIVLNAQVEPRFYPGIDEQTGFRTVALLAAPLWTRGRVVGVLEVVNKIRGEFDDDDCLLVETMAASAAMAIDNARMVQMLRQRTADLQAHQKKLDTFARAITEDLRKPLGLIVRSAQVLEQDYATLPRRQVRRHLRTIVDKGQDMVSVIDELLAVRTRLPQEIEEAIGPMDMARIVAGALERLAYLVEEHQAEVILPGRWPVALGHAPWVEEVWVNYLSHAIKHGGRPPRVEVGCDAVEQGDGTLRFWVRDNGPGLTPEEQVRLLAPVARRDTEYGMELALARRIVEKLGGQVGVESEMGQGSLVFFTLPKAD